MDTKDRKMLIVAVVVVVLIIILYYAYDKCLLLGDSKYAKKGCPGRKGGFCGAGPDPAAVAEAKGLHELGVREGFSGGCGAAAPAALAEAQGLMQAGWRPEHLQTRPTCAGPAPSAVAEAQGLQHAQALSPGSPYHEPFHGGSPPGESDDKYDVDGFAARKLSRDRAAYSSARDRSESLRSNPAQTSARQARLDSMREGFGGPAQAGYGWAPNVQDFAASPSTGGWGDAQSVGAAKCVNSCVDGCAGTHCGELCKDQCRGQALAVATGAY